MLHLFACIVLTSHISASLALIQSGCPAESVLYYENIEGGHGGAADARQQAYVSVRADVVMG